MESSTEIVLDVAASGKLFQATDIDVPRYVLQRLVSRGQLERVLRGVYIGAEAEREPLLEAAAVALRSPNAVVGLLSALVYHELTTEWARGVWVLIPRKMAPPQSNEITIHTVRVLPELIDTTQDDVLGIQTLSVHGVSVRITDPVRTVVDSLKYNRHISRVVALEALRVLRRSEHWNGARFYKLAKRFRVWSGVQSYLEGMR